MPHIASKENFEVLLEELKGHCELALDTETTGLRVYHGDVLFSIIIATATDEFYFNFNQYEDLDEKYILTAEHQLKISFFIRNQECTWFMHNAKFDMAMIGVGFFIPDNVKVWDTKAMERVLHNDLVPGSYDLDSCGSRRGWHKIDAPKKWCIENKAWRWIEAPGKKKREKKLLYSLVPWDIIVPYGCKDARITYDLAKDQIKKLRQEDELRPQGWPKIWQVVENEMQLTKTVLKMETVGVRIDEEYCKKAIDYNEKILEEKTKEFEAITGEPYKKSTKLFERLFESEAHKFSRTPPTKTKPLGGVSIDKKVLPNLNHPAAKIIVELSKAKSDSDYYHGFLFHADRHGIIHTSFNQDGTDTGRFSSSNPNLQNLKKPDEDDLEEEFVVRRAIKPYPGRLFVMMDFDQLQYRLMLDYAGAKSLISKILKEGLDVHQATADLANITRKAAKTTNFAILFGAGQAKLAAGLGCGELDARAIKEAVFRASPEIKMFINQCTWKAEKRGYVFNWYGRRYDMPDVNLSYTAPNKIIQGGEADLIKVGMNRCDKVLAKAKDTQQVLTIHDEIVFETCMEDIWIFAEIKEILEKVYPYRHLPLTVGVSHSFTSLADKIEGLPSEEGSKD